MSFCYILGLSPSHLVSPSVGVEGLEMPPSGKQTVSIEVMGEMDSAW